MKTLYLDCSMGASGDMFAGALIGLVDKDKFMSRLAVIASEAWQSRVSFELKEVEQHGIKGLKFSVLINGETEGHGDGGSDQSAVVNSSVPVTGHHHNTLSSITQTISNLKISNKTKENAIAVYNLLAQAESKAHNEPVNQIHFHEVGDLDAIADIVTVCMLIEEISPDKIICSPINTGSGTVKCAHGILPVPAPATKILLEGIPTLTNEIKSELCTPTGAALLKHFTTEFSRHCEEQSDAAIQKTSAGFGSKVFDKPNCFRMYLVSESSNRSIGWKCGMRIIQDEGQKGTESTYLMLFGRTNTGKEWYEQNKITKEMLGESPDFIVETSEGNKIGLEITNLIIKSNKYHAAKHNATATLKTIGNQVCEYFKKEKGIALSILIDFWDKRKWCARTYKESLEAAYDPGFKHLEAKNKEIKQAIIDAFSQEEIGLTDCIKKSIYVGSQIFNITATRWDEPYTSVSVNNAWISKEDPFEELQATINVKNDKYEAYKNKCDECDLLVVSDDHVAVFSDQINNHEFESAFRNIYLLDLNGNAETIKLKTKPVSSDKS